MKHKREQKEKYLPQRRKCNPPPNKCPVELPVTRNAWGNQFYQEQVPVFPTIALCEYLGLVTVFPLIPYSRRI